MQINRNWIALEGLDGCGKSTQAKRIAERMGAVLVREPGGTPLAEELRGILLSKEDREIDPHTELLLMMSARSSLYHTVILPALDAGRIVVSDRSILSSLAYQGILSGVGLQEILEAHEPLFAWLPTSVVLTVDVSTVTRRRGGGRDRIERRTGGAREKLEAAYWSAADHLNHRFRDAVVSVDGEGDIESVEQRILEAASSFIHPMASRKQ